MLRTCIHFVVCHIAVLSMLPFQCAVVLSNHAVVRSKRSQMVFVSVNEGLRRTQIFLYLSVVEKSVV